MGGERSATTLGELIATEGGSIKTGPFGTALKASEYSSVGAPLISVGEIGYGTFRIHESTPRVPPEVTARLPEYILYEGDIVFGRKGAVDRSARISASQEGWFLGSDGIRLRLPKTVDSRFMAYQLQSLTSRSWIVQHATGTTMASLNQSVIARVPVLLPKHSEQRAIAHILGTLDDKIELNRRRNQTLEAMARALFQDWFVDFGPVRAKMEGREPYLPAELWRPFPERLDDAGKPEGWAFKRASDFFALAYGKALPSSKRNFGKVPVYGSGGITGCHDEALINGPAIIVGRKGTVGSLYWEDRASFPIDTVFYVQPVAPLPFCYYLLNSLPLRDMNTDAAVPGLNRENVYRLEVAAPPATLIEAFSDRISRIRESIAAISKEFNTLAQLRDTLLPKLISGELRVADAEKFVEHVAP